MPESESGPQPSAIEQRLSGMPGSPGEANPMQELYDAAQVKPTAETEPEAVGDVSHYERGSDVQLPDERGEVVNWSVKRTAKEADPDHAGMIQVSHGETTRWVSGEDLVKAQRPAEELRTQGPSISSHLGSSAPTSSEVPTSDPDVAAAAQEAAAQRLRDRLKGL